MKHKLILITMLLLLGPGYSTAQNGPIVSFTYDDGFAGWYDIGVSFISAVRISCSTLYKCN